MKKKKTSADVPGFKRNIMAREKKNVGSALGRHVLPFNALFFFFQLYNAVF